MNNTDADFETSQKLERLDSDIQTTLQRLEELETERGQAVSDRADDVQGADERVQQAHAETDRLTRELDDMRAARQVEADRLAAAHRKAVEQANNERLQRLDAERQAINKQAKAADRVTDKLVAELHKLEEMGRQLSLKFGGTNPYHDAGQRAYNAIAERLTQRETARVSDVLNHGEGVLQQAHYPARLDDFAQYNQ